MNSEKQKRKVIISATIFFCSVVITLLVAGCLTPKKITPNVSGKNSPTKQSTNCNSGQKVHKGIENSTYTQIKKLYEYEQVCGSAVASKVSFFISTPITADEAISYSQEVASALKEFEKYGISPIVFMEPTIISGGKVNMSYFSYGNYDLVIDSFFSNLKSAGISDLAMGIWVPFPEGNTPVWSSLDPNIFSQCVTKTVTKQKKYFPDSKASIMLDSITYPNNNSWVDGQAISLVPYIKSIPTGLIDSFGLQGFPYADRASEGGESNGDVSDYLKMDLATEAANQLGVKSIWINTGTYSVKYPGSNDEIKVTASDRLLALKKVVAEAQKLKNQKFSVSIFLFAENKSETEEATDWSYWQTDTIKTSQHTATFVEFAHDLQQNEIELWLYDS